MQTELESTAAPGDAPAASGLEGRLARPADMAKARIMFACVIGNMLSATPVVHSSFGLFLLPISHEFDWPRARVSGVFGLLAVITAIIYPILGRIADRVGTRRIILAGSFAFGLSVVALSLGTSNVVWFYFLYAIIGVTGALPSTMMFTRVVSGWFDRTRGAMLGLASGLGNGVGATIMPIIAAVLMSRFGWRGAFVGLGAVVLTVSFPILATLLKEPASPSRRRFAAAAEGPATGPLMGTNLRQAAGTATFWMTLGAIALGAGCMGAVGSHIIPILSDRGFGIAEGTAVISTFAMVTAGWQVAVGWLLDKTNSPRIVAPFYVVSVLGLLLLEHATSLPLFILAGALMGIGMGSEYGALPYFLSRYFGLRCFGVLSGIMYSAVILAQGITPVLMDIDYDAHKSYLFSLHLIDMTLLLGAVVLLALRGYSATARLWTAAAEPRV